MFGDHRPSSFGEVERGPGFVRLMYLKRFLAFLFIKLIQTIEVDTNTFEFSTAV
jgi:hypothetical protein